MRKITLCAGLALSLLGLDLKAYNDKSLTADNGKSVFVMPSNVSSKDYMDKTIILKVKAQYRDQLSNNGLSIAPLNQLMLELGVTKVEKMFPYALPPKTTHNALRQKYADLSTVVVVKYSEQVDLAWAINRVIKTGVVEYAQPYYIQQVSYTPNDYNSGQQSFLAQIKAIEAWDLTKGDTNVVIGIVDSGTDLDHPDLVANFKRNYNEIPGNSIDDDNDGFVDNYIGYDLAGADFANIVGDGDPDIKGNNQSHGAHVSGDASAVTDNGTGVSGVGFNCKLLPVKCGADNDTRGSGGVGYILTGYQGITYAADHGANVINCSWGGPGAGPLEQEVVDYATINRGALVVAAAGNDNSETPGYPASLDGVINIAATGGSSADAKASFSNFGYTIDFCAPGNNIRSTAYNNSYGSNSGTSMASPVAAGAAAIVKSYYPNYNMLQVGEQLRVTCDNIYSVNTSYNNKLGSGRINLYKALTTSLPSLRSQNRAITDKNDDAFVINDTLRISMDFINYLAPTTSAAKVTLSAQIGGLYVTILNNSYTIGQLNTLALNNNGVAPFLVKVKTNARANERIMFKLTYSDGSTYSATEFFEVYVNVDYINIGINKVATSITSKGRIGYNGASQSQGIGFTYNGVNTLYEGGLMISNGTNVSDGIRNNDGTAQDDFKSLVAVSRTIPNEVSDFDAKGSFNDVNNAKGALPVTVRHYAHAWTNAPDDKYIMVRYSIKNTGSTTMNDLYAGIFCDYDIDDYNKNKGDQDAALRLGYSYATTAIGTHVGVKLLSPGNFIHHAIDNLAGAGGGPVDFSGAGDYELKKDSVMFIDRPTAGGTGEGNDVMQTVSSGPFTLAPGDSVEVAFALIGGDNLADLQASAGAAQTKYDGMVPTSIASLEAAAVNIGLYPNPSNGNSQFKLNLKESGHVQVIVTNMTGQVVKQEVYRNLNAGEQTVQLDLNDLANGTYLLSVKGKDFGKSERFTIVK